MKVIVPYADAPHSVTVQVLASEPVASLLYHKCEGPYAYHELLRDIWRKCEPVIIVEHDVVPWPGALGELWLCPCKWGAYSYHMHGGIGIFHGFGCTKLTPDVMEATADIWECEPVLWNTLDQKLWFAARLKGFEPHPHRPPVTHLNPRHLPQQEITGNDHLL